MSSNPSNKAAVDPKTSSNGSSEGQKLLQPDERVAFSTAAADLAAALVTAGIMNPA